MRAVIVGGGPAGAAAALTLLQARIPAVIVERERFPRYRPGETLHPGIEPLLDKLGVSDHLHAAGYLRHAGIWSAWGGAMRFVPYGEDRSGPWRGYQALRGDFDHRLLQSARDRGATVIAASATGVLFNADDEVAGVTTGAGPVQARCVIDASGGSHTLARQLRIPMVRHSPQLVARFGYASGRFDAPTPSICADSGGWTWMAEVEPHRFQWTRVTEAHQRPGREWIPDGLRGMDVDASRGADVTWRMAQTVAGPGYFLAGDAAAVLDPSSSHGVLRAIMSGMMAAHLSVRHLRFGAHAQACAAEYQAWLARGFQRDVDAMSGAYRSANLFGFNA